MDFVFPGRALKGVVFHFPTPGPEEHPDRCNAQTPLRATWKTKWPWTQMSKQGTAPHTRTACASSTRYYDDDDDDDDVDDDDNDDDDDDDDDDYSHNDETEAHDRC